RSGSNEGATPRGALDSRRLLDDAAGGVLSVAPVGSEQRTDGVPLGSHRSDIVPPPRGRRAWLGNRVVAGANGSFREPSPRGARARRGMARCPRYVAWARVAPPAPAAQ